MGAGCGAFVAETKGSLDSLDLRGIEDAKIACARKHFVAISGTNISYGIVRTYQDLLDIVTGGGRFRRPVEGGISGKRYNGEAASRRFG